MTHETSDAIAVIGMSGRFPGAETIVRFWDRLREGREAVTSFSDDELLASGVAPAALRDPAYVRSRPVLDAIDAFDAAFFRISPREAELMDPQHRIFLECAWEAMEDAAHDPWTHPGRVGVFASAGKNTYLLLNLLSQGDWTQSEEVFQLLLGNEKDYLTSRVSYKLNLKGPSLTIQTACSSSLVALHVACQSLLLGECDMAIVGGVSVDPPRAAGYTYRPGGILSPDGHCRAFDAGASGVTFGQGVGVVVLRPLADARADGDLVRAVIRGTAVNNDGADRVGFTAPSVKGQAAAIREALAVAGVDPGTIGYVEAHGTATAIGDPIEVQALTEAYGTHADRSQYCALGSVKTNIGHLGPAAGIAGLIKTVLALEHREIPPSLNFRAPNPQIAFAASPFFVNTERRAWTSDGPRRAAVSSFGQGGTNAHVVLEEAPPAAPRPSTHARYVLPISAQTEAALDGLTTRLAEFLDTTAFELADVAYSLQVGRRPFALRRLVVAATREEAAAALRQSRGATHVPLADGASRPVRFVFADVAPADLAWPEGGVYEREPAFRAAFDECCRSSDSLAESAARLRRGNRLGSAHAAALGVALQYSVARLFESWHVKPAATAAEGRGELARAAFEGRLTLADALKLASQGGFTDGDGPPRAIAGDSVTLVIAPRHTDGAASTLVAPRSSGGADSTLVTPRAPSGAASTLVAPRSSGGADSTFVAPRSSGGAALQGCRDDLLVHAAADLARAFGELWLHGAACDWRAYHAAEPRARVPLPTYPFERRRHWIEPKRRPADADAAGETRATAAADASSPDEVRVVLAGVFQAVLGMPHVGPTDDFFDCGGHSLLESQVRSRVETAFGVRLPQGVLFDRPTVAALAEFVVAERATGARGEPARVETIAADVVLDERVTAAGRPRVALDRRPTRVFLTGATGLLGSHVLDELLASTDAHVYCLVRAASGEEAFRKIADTARLYGLHGGDLRQRMTPIIGDLARPRFGLGDAEYEALASEVDALYHCGAHVNFVQPYATLKRINVRGTQEMLALAATARTKPLHHMSSIAVFESAAFEHVKFVTEETDIGSGEGFHNGYDMTKWVSERIVGLARERGLPASIYRLSNIAGHSRTGIMLPQHIVASLIKGCVQLGVAPAGDDIINVLPVDVASRMVVALSLEPGALGRTFHLVNPESTRIRDVVGWLTARGYDLEPRTYDEWREALRAAPDDNVFKPFLPLLDEAPLFTNRSYDNVNVRAWLPDLDCLCPPFDAALLDCYLAYLTSTGYIPEGRQPLLA